MVIFIFLFIKVLIFFIGKQVQWTERLSVDGSSLNLREILAMMIVDIILYGVLTWYLDNIRPGKFGVPRHWFFFIKVCFTYFLV